MEIKDRVRELRERLGLSQAQLASRTGGELDQSYITKIEAGRNKASTVKVREALAKGFWLKSDVFSEYLEGKRSLENTIPLVQAPRESDRTLRENRDSLIEKAIARGMAGSYGTLSALDFVRELFKPLTDNLVPGEFFLNTWSNELTQTMAHFIKIASTYPPVSDLTPTGWPKRPPTEDWPEMTPELLVLLACMDLMISSAMYRAQLEAAGVTPIHIRTNVLAGRKTIFEYESTPGIRSDMLVNFFKHESDALLERYNPAHRLTEIYNALLDTSWPQWHPDIPRVPEPKLADSVRHDPSLAGKTPPDDDDDGVPF